MLPPYIIEEIRRREQQQRQYEQPRIELPLPSAVPDRSPKQEERDDADRGVIIIDLLDGF
ncbi:MAG: hypothetical protein JNK72_07210 [Myxococcales bacterium]|nr:hypothetical protein [Myxococcales bacterium]